MALVFSDDIWDRWRLPALALAAAAIIVVPWLTLRKLQQDNELAMGWVTHTQQVTVALQQLQTDVRDHVFSLDLLGQRQSTQNLEVTAGLTCFF